MTDPRRFSEAAARNQGPILEVLRRLLPHDGQGGLVLEVGAGSGRHAVHFARALPWVRWLPSDSDPGNVASIRAYREDAGLENLLPPVQFDVHSAFWPVEQASAVYCANLMQVAPWSANEALLRGAAQVLDPGAPLVLYGPMFVEGEEPAPSNVTFDTALKARDPEWGVRSLSDLESLAYGHGFECPEVIRMPANNLIVASALLPASGRLTLEIFWPGIAAMAFMYVAVFLVGVYASKDAPHKGEQSLEGMLAGRALPLWVGLLTMTATWVGGGYINGTAESTFSRGILWGGQAGIGYALSLVLGGLVFAKVMRRHAFATLVDPLEVRYGKGTAALLMVPAVLAELFWSAAILVALGSTFGTIVGLDLFTATLVSAAVAVGYTVFGGLRAVAYTDVVQLFLILIGLGIAIPFAISAAGGPGALGTVIAGHDGVPGALTGFKSVQETLSWLDWCFILMLGGIPWNVYFQRVLSSPDEASASKLSLWAGGLCLLMALPPLTLGLCGRAIDWSVLASTEAGLAMGGPEVVAASLKENPAFVLPYILRLAVPTWVSVLGLGAVSAAVMSSVDSSILSAASLIAWNGYRRLINPAAAADDVRKLVQWLVVALGAAATTIALTVQSVASLWYLCGDVVYTVLFPQLTLALFDKKANRTGALAGLAVSVFLRLGGGEATLGLPAFLPYPAFSDGEFPFRTVAMLCGLATAFVVARLTQASDPPRSIDTPMS